MGYEAEERERFRNLMDNTTPGILNMETVFELEEI